MADSELLNFNENKTEVIIFGVSPESESAPSQSLVTLNLFYVLNIYFIVI